MTDADDLAAALLAHDVAQLRRLTTQLTGELQAAARAGLQLLGGSESPDEPALPAPALDLLRVIAGHPGLTLAELVERVGPQAREAATLLRERGLVTSVRFERTDCWSRTAAGAALLRAAVPD